MAKIQSTKIKGGCFNGNGKGHLIIEALVTLGIIQLGRHDRYLSKFTSEPIRLYILFGDSYL